MSGNNGESAPGWFTKFYKEFHESTHSFNEKLNENNAEIHAVRLSVDGMRISQDKTNKELLKTRQQSAKLFRRLIAEVKTLRARR